MTHPKNFINKTHNQLTFTCSKPTTETSEKGVKYFNNKNTRTRH